MASWRSMSKFHSYIFMYTIRKQWHLKIRIRRYYIFIITNWNMNDFLHRQVWKFQKLILKYSEVRKKAVCYVYGSRSTEWVILRAAINHEKSRMRLRGDQFPTTALNNVHHLTINPIKNIILRVKFRCGGFKFEPMRFRRNGTDI